MTEPLTLFAEPGPRIFAAPSGRAVADAVAEGVLQRLADAGYGPERLLDVEILVSTRRATKALASAFARASGGVALGPRMRALTEAGEGLETAPGIPLAPLPPAVKPLDRLMALTKLTRSMLESAPHLAAPTAAPSLAKDLAALMDEAHASGVDLGALDSLAPENQARHWEDTAQFLDVLRVAWPHYLGVLGVVDPAERRQALVARLEQAWAASPPSGPVIAVGSPTDASATWLIALVARLPQGAAIVPGADPEMPEDVAAALAHGGTPEHPQAAFMQLLDAAGLAPSDVRLWAEEATASAAARRRLLSQAMRPAPVTDAWRDAAPVIAAEATEAVEGVSLLEAPGPREEALAIALALREALETPGRTAALVTPDRTLARRVAGDLARWGVNPDDSSGRPLSLTPPGVFFRLVLDAARPQATLQSLLAMLGHPLCGAGLGRGLHLRLKRRLERDVLRGAPPTKGAAAVAGLIAFAETRDHAPIEPELGLWFARVLALLTPLTALLVEKQPDLEAIARAHAEATEALSAGVFGAQSEAENEPAHTGETAPEADVASEPELELEEDEDAPAASGLPPVYQKVAGEALAAFLQRFVEASASYGAIAPSEYSALLSEAMGSEAVREPFGRHARVAILGPLEARMLSADLVILAGLNEGLWPRVPTPDAWLSRDMRAQAGLPPLEAQVGLSASDFVQAAMAKTAILSRALKSDGSPTTPSRWLLRLETLLKGVAPHTLDVMRERGQVWLDLAARFDVPSSAMAGAARPAPRPPVEARPRDFSVTEVETLIRDPYAIYARKVLRLRPLPPLEEGFDLRDRGELMHELVERFVKEWRELPWNEAVQSYDALADDVLSAVAADPTLHAVWRARAAQIRDWLLTSEAERRSAGAPAALEASGLMTMQTAFGETSLRAKADRIDRLNSGGYALYDYKTGAPPTPRQVDSFAKQMPLQAAILNEVGFEGVEPGVVSHLAFLQLKGGVQGGREAALGESAGDVRALADEAIEGFARLVSAYANPDLSYLSRARPKLLTYDGDYDHLARRGEWTDGEDGGEG